jgi:GxxExxY protein
MGLNDLTEKIIGAAIDVHRELGPGLLESTYEACMLFELAERGLSVDRQKPCPLFIGTYGSTAVTALICSLKTWSSLSSKL